MDPKFLTKQMIDFNRTAFAKAFDGLVMVQDQMEKVMGLVLEQNQWLPPEGKKAYGDWVRTYKQARDEFKGKVEEGYEQVESFLDQSGR
jgi:hypothetical protein